MIIPLYSTTSSDIARKLLEVREEGGVNTLGRVLTLVITTDEKGAEAAIETANAASMEHPCRVIVLIGEDPTGASALDAEIRVGGDAGASEVVVLRSRGELVEHQDALITPLMLPDAPIVAWWPSRAPIDPYGDPIGAQAQRRIIDSKASNEPLQVLGEFAQHYHAGDTDLAWSRITLWRAQLAVALDAHPMEVKSATVTGRWDHPSCYLLAAWLGHALGCRVKINQITGVEAIVRAELKDGKNAIVLDRPDGDDVASLSIPGEKERKIALAMRSAPDCLVEELRRLDSDEVFGEVVRDGLKKITLPSSPPSNE